MNLFTIPLRNIKRKPSKSLLLVLIFSLGVMSITALYQVSLLVGESLEKKLTAFGANIIISPAREKLSVSYGGFHMGDMLFDIQELNETDTVNGVNSIGYRERISTVAPKLVTMTQINETAIALVGVRWDQELRIKSYWAPNGEYPQTGDEILLGNRAASTLGLNTGDTVEIHGRSLTVSGVLYETGGDDDSVILMDLGILQELLNRPQAVSFVEVAALCAGCPIDDITAQIRNALPGVTVKALQKVVNQRMASVKFVQKLALTISLVILVTASAMVGLSMLSAVNERKKDIGILRSLGYTKGHVFLIFCLEAGLIGAVSGLVGYLTGFAASFKALELLALAESATPSFSAFQMVAAMAVFSLVTIVSTVYPAWKGASIEPSTALTAL